MSKKSRTDQVAGGGAPVDVEQLAREVQRLRQDLDGSRSESAELKREIATLSEKLSRPKRTVRADQIIAAHPRSNYESHVLSHFSNAEIVSVRKHFKGGDATRAIEKRPFMRDTPKVRELLEFLYRFQGANYGVIADLGIWRGGLSAVCTEMLCLDAAGFITRNPYTHRYVQADPELRLGAGQVVREPSRIHVTLQTRSIRLLKEWGAMTSTTSPAEIKKRLRGKEADWAHRNNTLHAALTQINQDTDPFVGYEWGWNEREHQNELKTFFGAKKFGEHSGRYTAPDVSLRKTVYEINALGERVPVSTTFIAFEYDAGNYTRKELAQKTEILRGPFGHELEPTDAMASVVDEPDYDEDDPEADDDMAIFEKNKPKQNPAEYWADKTKDYDDVKYVLVAYNARVREQGERYLGVNYEGDDDVESRRAEFVGKHVEFVTLQELDAGKLVA